jgi:hypothetical protein
MVVDAEVLMMARLGTLFSAARHAMAQHSVEVWLKTWYEKEWIELEKTGFSTTRQGTLLARIKRDLEP